MDVRRELGIINKHFRRHHDVAGETIVWYEFEPLGPDSADSIYDDIYDEGIPGVGGRQYKSGVVLPVLLSSENEDQRRAIPEGRLPLQTINMFISIADMQDAGISSPWEYKPHLNDIFSYDGRYYSVYNYRVRGRLRDDVFVLVDGQEILIDQEFPNDPGPEILRIDNYPWPATLPTLG